MIDPNNYDQRHGGPFDRGSADAYYQRPIRPHYFTGATYQSQEILVEVGTEAYNAYVAGYNWTVDQGDFKQWD